MVNGSKGEAVIRRDLAAPVAQSPQNRAKTPEIVTGKLRLGRRVPMRHERMRNRINDLR
jgi:hypothetical protein